MQYRTLALALEPPVARIRLARPDEGNPIDERFLQELPDACQRIHDASDVHVTLLTAEGDSFSTGWAPAELEGGPATSRLDASPPFACLEAMAQPVVCAINGAAISAGLELALACDVRIAAEGARSALPETSQGQLPMAGGTQRLARLVGRGEALRLILLGEEIDAQEALRVGLVSAVVPRERLTEEAEAIAQRIASRGPLAVRYAKEAVRRGIEQPLDQALRYETDLTIILQTTEDRVEGVRAFVEKRPPKFTGQ
jgi:enoyl-CoA hydratase/carnithine racemase